MLILCFLSSFLLSLSQSTLSPPGPPAPAAAPFSARPTIGARTPPAPGPDRAPLAEQLRRDLPAGDRPPLLPSAASGTSPNLEARAPVQESVSGTHIPGGHKVPLRSERWGVGSLW